MRSNYLQLNAGKTEVICFNFLLTALPSSTWPAVWGPTLVLAPHGKNLGVLFDSKLSVAMQVNHMVQVGSYKLRLFRQLSQYLPENSRKAICNVMVISQNDYVNMTLLNLPAKQIQLQSTATRILTGPHIKPTLRNFTGCQ